MSAVKCSAVQHAARPLLGRLLLGRLLHWIAMLRLDSSRCRPLAWPNQHHKALALVGARPGQTELSAANSLPAVALPLAEGAAGMTVLTPCHKCRFQSCRWLLQHRQLCGAFCLQVHETAGETGDPSVALHSHSKAVAPCTFVTHPAQGAQHHVSSAYPYLLPSALVYASADAGRA